MDRGDIKRFININVIIIAGEILFWVFLNLTGSTLDAGFMVEHGAMYPTLLIEEGDWWRLFTACLLHFDAGHLFGNMFAQYFMGNILLQAVNGWKFALIYFLSGVAGNVLSYNIEIMTGNFSVSAGASGAIYGIMGAIFMVVIKNGGRFRGVTLKRMALATVIYILYGFSSPGVDAWAHLGGLIAGFLANGLLYSKTNNLR